MSAQFARKMCALLLTGLLLLALGGCDAIQQKLGMEAPAAKAARLEGEGKAVGGACRQSGRAIEDCYSIYSWLPKAAIYEGWRDMDVYMRENKLPTVEPQLPPPQPPGSKKAKPSAAREGGATEAKEEAKDGGKEAGKESAKEGGKPSPAGEAKGGGQH